jgi:tryptophan synthase beta chain
MKTNFISGEMIAAHQSALKLMQRPLETVVPLQNPHNSDLVQSQGLYQDVENLLSARIEAQPDDDEAKLRLLELYYAGRQSQSFLGLAEAMAHNGLPTEDPELWGKVMRMGRELSPGEALFKHAGTGPHVAVAATRIDQVATERWGDGEKYTSFFKQLAADCKRYTAGQVFTRELDKELYRTLKRPSALMHAKQLSAQLGGAQIYFKREDTCAPIMQLKIAVIAQAMLANKMGKEMLVASSRSGFSGVVVAATARRMGMQCRIYVERIASAEHPDVRQRLVALGADVQPVDILSLPGGDLRAVALDDVLEHWASSFLVMGLDGAPQPYPQLVLQSEAVIGRELMQQYYAINRRLPDLLVANLGDNASAIGFMLPFLCANQTRLTCMTNAAALEDVLTPDDDEPIWREYELAHARILAKRQSKEQRVKEGLEYPSVQREQAWLKASHRIAYVRVAPPHVKQTIQQVYELEGIMPGLETAYALAHAVEAAPQMKSDESVIVLITAATHKKRSSATQRWFSRFITQPGAESRA